MHAALVDWQRFESGSGVGLANFRHEEPWRPPSLLLEADPPWRDAPRRVLREILTPPAPRRLRETWQPVAEELVDQVLAEGAEFDAFTAPAQAFPLRAFPDAVGLGPDGRERLLPYDNIAFNAFGPRNDLVAVEAQRVAARQQRTDHAAQPGHRRSAGCGRPRPRPLAICHCRSRTVLL
ncbi:hypothetical protein [Streptomyces canus]|uniref:hypothetical protein n=1 Tax=Streptomyces canus TaxID=58343 RepID=UPI0032472EFD